MVSRRQRNKINQSKMRAKALYAFTGLLVLIMLLAAYESTKKTKEIDSSTFCKKNAAETISHHVVLFDPSDTLNFAQRSFLKSKFNSILNEVDIGSKISIYALSNNVEDLFNAKFSMCKPRDGSNTNDLIENQLMITKKWEEEFKEPFFNQLESLTNSLDISQSPIMESIQAVTIQAFQDKNYKSKKLTIISDMLQNTKKYNHYSTQPDFKSFSRSSYYKRVSTKLNDVDINILYINRDGAERIQNNGNSHIKFWVEYFSDQNGAVKSVERVDG